MMRLGGKRWKEVWLCWNQGLGGLLCRRGTDLLCYFNLIQILTHNLGLMVWLQASPRGRERVCVQHLALTLVKVTVLLWYQITANKCTSVQFSLAGFVLSSPALPVKNFVYFSWNGWGPVAWSSFKNKPLKRKIKEREQKSDLVW